jgi:hypothetical protein
MTQKLFRITKTRMLPKREKVKPERNM